MFENLSEKLGQTLRNWRGKGKLSAENIHPALREIRAALLEADVALSVIKAFLTDLEQKVIGQEVPKGLEPEQFFIKLVNQALIDLMGGAGEGLNLNTVPPAVILMAGLQGAGKTTLVGKLAKWIKRELNKSVVIATCDINRPAAREQLKILADSIDTPFFEPKEFSHAPTVAKTALEFAKQQVADILLIDTAGRLHVDQDLMAEIQEIHAITNPIETLFVVDSMTGQDAANSAKIFGEHLPLTGVVLTKIDGDSRGGAALSVKYLTGKPIKFLSVGEKIDDLEVFHPDRIASRILGMGDVLTLIEELERKIDKDKAEKLAKKIKKGKSFDLEDLREQLKEMNKMGGLGGIASKLPGMGNLLANAQSKSQLSETVINQMVAIINSMTLKERRFPNLIQGSRKRRIASGSGTDIPAVNKVLKQHLQMQKMMKKFANPGSMMKMMRGIQGMLPPGMFPFGK